MYKYDFIIKKFVQQLAANCAKRDENQLLEKDFNHLTMKSEHSGKDQRLCKSLMF